MTAGVAAAISSSATIGNVVHNTISVIDKTEKCHGLRLISGQSVMQLDQHWYFTDNWKSKGLESQAEVIDMIENKLENNELVIMKCDWDTLWGGQYYQLEDLDGNAYGYIKVKTETREVTDAVGYFLGSIDGKGHTDNQIVHYNDSPQKWHTSKVQFFSDDTSRPTREIYRLEDAVEYRGDKQQSFLKAAPNSTIVDDASELTLEKRNEGRRQLKDPRSINPMNWWDSSFGSYETMNTIYELKATINGERCVIGQCQVDPHGKIKSFTGYFPDTMISGGIGTEMRVQNNQGSISFHPHE